MPTLQAKKFGNGSSDNYFDIVNPEFRKAQSELINDVNPAPNTYNTWIRSVKDIADPEEIFTQDEFMGAPDWYLEKAESALRNGEITVYSSYPIKDGVFVSPSYQEALGYAGGGKVYSKKVPLDCRVGKVYTCPPNKINYSKFNSNILFLSSKLHQFSS